MAAVFQSMDWHDFLKKALDSVTPMVMQNASPNAVLSPFEQWLGIRGASRIITGAPAPSRATSAML